MLIKLIEELENLGVLRADFANGGLLRMNDQRMPSLMRNYTWAARPAADALPKGTPIYVTDVGGNIGGVVAGSWWLTDGVQWRPLNGSVVLLHTATAVTAAAGGAADQTMHSFTVPGGLMGANGYLRISTLWTASGAAESKTARILFGGTQITSYSGASGFAISGMTHVRNRNSQTAQVCAGTSNFGAFGTGQGTTTLAIDTAADVVVDMRCSPSGGESITFQSATIELIK